MESGHGRTSHVQRRVLAEPSLPQGHTSHLLLFEGGGGGDSKDAEYVISSIVYTHDNYYVRVCTSYYIRACANVHVCVQ